MFTLCLYFHQLEKYLCKFIFHNLYYEYIVLKIIHNFIIKCKKKILHLDITMLLTLVLQSYLTKYLPNNTFKIITKTT